MNLDSKHFCSNVDVTELADGSEQAYAVHPPGVPMRARGTNPKDFSYSIYPCDEWHWAPTVLLKPDS